MTSRPSLLVQLGGGLASTAIGIGVPAAGADGAPVLVLSAIATIAGLSFFIVGLRRASRRPPAPTAIVERPSVSERSRTVGVSVVDFLADRVVQTPREPANPVAAYRQRRAHDDDTMQIYNQEYLPDVRAVLRDLLAQGHVGRKEVRRLLNARDCREVERVGRRLQELGRSADRRPRRGRPRGDLSLYRGA